MKVVSVGFMGRKQNHQAAQPKESTVRVLAQLIQQQNLRRKQMK